MALERVNSESIRLGAAVLSLALVLSGCKKEVANVVDVEAAQSAPADISKAVAESATATAAPVATDSPDKIVDSIDPKMVEQLANEVKSPIPLVLSDDMFEKAGIFEGDIKTSSIYALLSGLAKNLGCDQSDLVYKKIAFEEGVELEFADGGFIVGPDDKTAFGYFHNGKLVFRVDILHIVNQAKGNEMDVKSFKARVLDENGEERESLKRFHYSARNPFHPQRNFAGLTEVSHVAHAEKDDQWEQIKITGTPKHSENQVLLDHFFEVQGESLVVRDTADGKAIYGRHGKKQYSVDDSASKEVDRFTEAYSR